MTTKNKNFPIAVYNHEKEAYWYIYSIDEFLEFLNEHDEFFTYKKEIDNA